MIDYKKISNLILSDTSLYVPIYKEIVSNVCLYGRVYVNVVQPYPRINGILEENVIISISMNSQDYSSTNLKGDWSTDEIHLIKDDIRINSYLYPDRYEMSFIQDTIFNYNYVIAYIRDYRLNHLLSS